MATKFSDFTAQAATGTTFVVGYDGTTNTQYSQDNLTNFVLDGTLSGNRNVGLGTYNLGFTNGKVGIGTSSPLYTLDTKGTVAGNWLARVQNDSGTGYGLQVKVDSTDSAKVTFATKNGSGYTTAIHNDGNVSIGINNIAVPSARLHIKGAGLTDATTAFLVEDSDGNDIIKALDDRTIGLGYNGLQITTDSTSGGNVWLRNTTGSPLFSAGVVAGATGKINVYGGYYNTFEYAASKGLVFTNEAGFSVPQDLSSMLTCISVTKGFLPPRMTTTQRDAINSGTFTTGLTLYNTTDNKLQFYNGTAWTDAGGGGDNIYTADGSISENRTVTIANNGNVPYSVNFKGNSGAAGAGPVFLQIENERVDGAYSTNSGAQLRLRGGSSSGSLNADLDIIAHGSNYGGSGAPQVHFNSNRGYTFTAGAAGSTTASGVSQDFVLKAGSTGQIITSATTNFGNNTNTTIAMIGGGGSSSSMIQMGKSGNDIGKFFRGSANGILQIGKHSGGVYGTAGTTTTEIYVDGSSNVGIGDNTTISAKLHVKGAGATFATTTFQVENSNGDDLINIRDSGRFAIGLGAYNANDDNVVFGNNAQANGTANNNVVIGHNATTTASNSIIVGGGTTTSDNTIILGSAYINGTEAIAIGNSSRSNLGSVSIGHDSGAENNNGNYNLCLGTRAKNTTNANNVIVLNATGSTTATSGTTDDTFSVFMSSNTTPDFKVISNEGMIPPSITTTVRDAISSPNSGSTIYNTTDNKLQFYNGTAWTDAGGGGDNIYTADGTISGNRDVNLGTNNLSFTNGEVGIGTTTFTNVGTGISGLEISDSTSGSILLRNDASSSVSYWYNHSTGTYFGTKTNNKLNILQNDTVRMNISTDGNLAIGQTTTAASARLHVKGAGLTNGTTSLLVEDFAGADMLSVKDDGQITIGSGATIQSTSNPQYSVVMGYGAKDRATAGNAVESVAIGRLAAGNGSSVAIGGQAKCLGVSAVAIGAQAQAAATGTSIGLQAGGASAGSSAVSIGKFAQAKASGSIAIGTNTGLTGANSIVLNATTGVTSSTTTDTFDVYMSDATTPDFKIAHDGNSYITGTGNFGFGAANTSPTATVDIDGTFRLRSATNVSNQILTADSNGNATWSNSLNLNGQVKGGYESGVTTLAFDWDNGNIQKSSATGAQTFSGSNAIAGSTYLIMIGTPTVTWGSSVKWPGDTAPTLAGTTNIITLLYDGTSYYATSVLNYS